MPFPSMETLTSGKDLNVGFGVYIEMTSLSHSCSPNSALIPNGLSLQLRAMKQIDVGTDITISYVDVYDQENDPHKELKDHFLIDCNCDLVDRTSERRLNKMFELLIRNMDSFNTGAMPDICPGIVDKIFVTAEQLIGYHLELCGKLMLDMMQIHEIPVFNNRNRIKAKSEFFRRFDSYIMVTFGADNPWYTLYKQLIQK